MIPIADLDRIAKARLADAKALTEAGCFDAGFYLCGYAVEIALKARICRTLGWSGFPDSNSEFHNLQSFRTHALNTLLLLSGRQNDIETTHKRAWRAVKEWRPELRYSRVGTSSAADAAKMIEFSKELLGALQ